RRWFICSIRSLRRFGITWDSVTVQFSPRDAGAPCKRCDLAGVAACSAREGAYTALMKLWVLCLGAACVLLPQAHAQLSVEILPDQEQVLKDESVPIKVRITNRSGQTLKLGNETNWLTFTVTSRDGLPVVPLRDV